MKARSAMIPAAIAIASLAAGCARHRAYPEFMPSSETDEAAYAPFLVKGTAVLTGQAFAVQRNGGVVKAAGRTVTLDPATSIGNDWYSKAGRLYQFRYLQPGSPGFRAARRSVTADAEGRFKFTDLPAGTYYVRTEVTWEIGPYHPIQGGLLSKQVRLSEGSATDVILN